MEKKDFLIIEEKFETENFSGETGFRIEEGKNLSIMISAPHSVSQYRNGKIKVAEKRTGIIVLLLKEMLDLSVIYKTKNKKDDANFDDKNEYRDTLVEYIKENKVKCLLDFHIAGSKRPFHLEIGTGQGKNIHGRDDLKEEIINSLGEKYERITVDEFFPAKNPNTVSATIAREVGIPAFQIEINWKIIENYDKMLDLIKCFGEILKKLEKKLETQKSLED